MHNCQHPCGCSQLRMDSPTAGKQSTGLFSDPPFESAPHTKKETVHSDGLFFGARDGTRTHTAKPHAPQTCLSTIPTLSQSVLKYYSGAVAFCQQLFPKPLHLSSRFGTLKETKGEWTMTRFFVTPEEMQDAFLVLTGENAQHAKVRTFVCKSFHAWRGPPRRLGFPGKRTVLFGAQTFISIILLRYHTCRGESTEGKRSAAGFSCNWAQGWYRMRSEFMRQRCRIRCLQAGFMVWKSKKH